MTTVTIRPELVTQFRKEPNFKLFKHAGLHCAVWRMTHNGNLNGYVGIPKDHPFYGKQYSDKVSTDKDPEFNGNFIGLLVAAMDNDHALGIYSIDMLLKAHGGITYSRDHLGAIGEGVLEDLWWFGFDTNHAWDISPIQDEWDLGTYTDSQYRNYLYVEENVKSLAEQLAVKQTAL